MTREELWKIANSEEGIKSDELPKIFADAFTVTRRLGFRYLYVDALCVDPLKRDEELADAVSVYGQATLMIAATAAENCNAGILNERYIYYSPGFGPKEDRFLRQKLLRWDWDIDNSPLNSRGWATLERMLAPRIVHFTKRQMIWECASPGLRFEASGISDKLTGSGQIMMQYRKETFQPLVTQAIERIKGVAIAQETKEHTDPRKEPSIGVIETDIISDRLKEWHKCIDAFSGRALTEPSDKLPAVSALATVVDDGTMGDYLAGIWSKNIAAGLCWGRVWALLKPAPTYRAPSWSWASLDGSISSSFLSWPEGIMEEHARDPEWTNRYGLKLLEHHMKPRNPENPYMGVLKGSHIVVEGACLENKSFFQLIKSDLVHVTAVLDKANTFDCPCCAPKSDDQPEEEQTVKSGNPEDHLPFHLVMILQGNAWRKEGSQVYMLLLKWTNKEETELERVGVVGLRADRPPYGQLFSSEALHKMFDAASWERKIVKLV